jgi:LysR family transcriptional regulator, glycine cleavage system transcriptional activator
MTMAARTPSLETLRIFDACARHGNFSRAADELCITPAAVSQRIRSLETDAGKPLFARNGPRIRLNDDGEKLFRQTRAIMTLAHAAIDELRMARALRLTVAPTFASRWLASRLPEFEVRHPGIAIDIDVSADVRDLARHDLAIRSGNGRWPDTDATVLFAVEATPMLAPRLLQGRTLSDPADLASFPMIASSDWPRWFAAQQLPAPDRRTAQRTAYPSQDLAAQAAIDGQGVALLSPRLFAAELASARLVQPFAFTLSGPDSYWLVEPRTDRSPAARAFRDWLLESIAPVSAG